MELIMNEEAVSNARSDAMKKHWEKRKEKAKEKNEMNPIGKKLWIFHGEWIGLMATICTCFGFLYSGNKHIGERLDRHIEAINRRTDQISADTNRRCDELHKEFYDLLKEMRK